MNKPEASNKWTSTMQDGAEQIGFERREPVKVESACSLSVDWREKRLKTAEWLETLEAVEKELRLFYERMQRERNTYQFSDAFILGRRQNLGGSEERGSQNE